VKLVEAVLNGVVIQRPEPSRKAAQHLCADKGYIGRAARRAMCDRGYIPHVPDFGEPTDSPRTTMIRAHRWVVEALHSWLNRFRKLLVRYEKTDLSYEALLHFACAIIAWRKARVNYG
jgi:transposase